MASTDTHVRQYPTAMSISLQLHSMRRLDGLDTQLAAARAAGFARVEGLEQHLISAADFRKSLDRFQLVCPSAHVSMGTLMQNRPRIIENCLEAGILCVFVNPMPLDNPADPGLWKKAGEELGNVADEFGRHGIVLGYHNGSHGFEPLKSGRCGIESLFRSAAGSPLKWQADIGWIRRAQGNPAEWLKRLGAYLVSAHIKDVGADMTIEDGWQNVGTGLLVWPILLNEAMRCGARSFVVEHDNPPDPAEFARRSFAYLSKFNARAHPP